MQAQISSGEAIGYNDPTTITGPPFTFTTTGCDTVAFAPDRVDEVGDRGTTKFNGYPPLTFKISQPAGTQADIQNVKVLLPIELNTNNPAYKLCTQAQADADACPANSKFGGAIAKSPFLQDTVSGPVYLIQQTASSLPGLLIDLNGRVHVKIQTRPRSWAASRSSRSRRTRRSCRSPSSRSHSTAARTRACS